MDKKDQTNFWRNERFQIAEFLDVERLRSFYFSLTKWLSTFRARTMWWILTPQNIVSAFWSPAAYIMAIWGIYGWISIRNFRLGKRKLPPPWMCRWDLNAKDKGDRGKLDDETYDLACMSFLGVCQTLLRKSSPYQLLSKVERQSWNSCQPS